MRSQALSITIAPPALTITTTSLANGTGGTAYNQTLAATGGAGGYTWSMISGSLPASLSLSAGGAITGTPSAAGTATFTVQVKDSTGTAATQSLTLTIAPPTLTITTSSLPNGTVGTPYSETLAATGGAGGYAWSTSSGSLPAGLSLSASGTVSGTPTAAGAASLTVQIKDSAGATASQSIALTILPPALIVMTAALANGTLGSAYNQSLSASGGTSPYGWSMTSGSLPSGLSLSAGGAITGTPTAAGPATFTIEVKDSAGATATQALTLTIAAPALSITTTILAPATAGAQYSQTLAAIGGSGKYSWSVTSGSLPPGLSVSTAGAIGGTPTTAGTFNFTATVNDGTTASAHAFAIIVAAPLSIASTTLATGIAGVAYAATLSATGGAPPYTWTVISGQLPQGLSLDPAAGVISGTPKLAGAYTVRIDVNDSASAQAAANFTLTIRAGLSITTASVLATASAGGSYTQSFAAAGGAPPYTWTVSGTLPTGLTFSASGILSGTPTQVGTFPITVQVADSGNAIVTAGYSISVVSGLAIATAPVLPVASIGVPYSFTLQPAGGAVPYSWVVSSGALPGGLSFSGSGQISGTPTSTGSFSFTAQVTDGNSRTAQKAFTLGVAGPLSITSASLPGGATGSPYTQTLTAAGGTPPYSWTVTAGSLPTGLTLEIPTGAIAGTPTAPETFSFTVTVTDSNSVAMAHQFTIAIAAGLTFTTAASLPAATAGIAYSTQLQAFGGQTPYAWSVVSGNLPGGLSLNGASGLIGGTPTAAGTFNFTVQINDASNLTAMRVYTIVAGVPALPAISLGGISGNVQPMQQPTITLALANPYPIDITGTVTLKFTPAGPNGVDDPSVQFATGGRSATFTIPANAIEATLGASQFAVQSGTVAGTITITVVSLQAGGVTLDVPQGLTMTATIAPAAPAILSINLVHTANGIQLQLQGVSDTRDLTQASITFQPASGSSLQNTQLTVLLSSVATPWFQSAASASYGGQFALTLPFTFQGNVSLISVSVILSNSVGDSQPASGNY